MGCRICGFTKNEKNQEFDYNSEIISIQNECYHEVNESKLNDEFTKYFDEKINYIGKYVTLQNFEYKINKNILNCINKHPFKIPENISNNYNSFKINPIEFNNGNIFFGHWNSKLEMEGYGKYLLTKENVFAEGIWEQGDLKYGRVFLPNGEIYIGEFKNSEFNGKGKLISHDEVYEGDFVNGDEFGKGKITFEDGTVYEGDIMKGGVINGEGVMKWKNGIEYKGEFYDFTLCGKGEISNTRGEKYIGDFDKNFFHGKGVYYFSNGDIYDGIFELGYRKGKGIYKKKDGIEYEGEWENNLLNGEGTIKNDNFFIKCVFKDGKIMDKPVYEKGNEEENKNIDLNLASDSMTIDTNELTNLEHSDLKSVQYQPGDLPSFLKE